MKRPKSKQSSKDQPVWQGFHAVDGPVGVENLSGIFTQNLAVSDHDSHFFGLGSAAISQIGAADVKVRPENATIVSLTNIFLMGRSRPLYR